MNTQLLEFLRRLPPSGSDGFEGLVAKQLGFLTGRRFYLAQSGTQSGRDMTSDRQQSNVIAVECKRFGDDRPFNLPELQGKLEQAEIENPDLDLWVLAATRAIPDQVITSLRLQGDKDGIEIQAISPNDGCPSSLELLCACASDTTVSYLTGHLKQAEIETLRQKLNAIKAHAVFQESLCRLRKEFNAEEIGYENWRRRQNEWFVERLQSERESRAAFLQILNVEDSATSLVERRSAWNNLDGWLSAWSRTGKPFVLHGEEGDGKTWATASWLSRSIRASQDFPPVVFLSSRKVDSDQPHFLLSGALARQLGEIREGIWAKKLGRWMKKLVDRSPVVLLVLDGINECQTPDWWMACINAFAAEPWYSRVALLITCRTFYWSQYIAPHRGITAQAWSMPPFDDEELDQALARRGLSRSEFSPDLLRLVRKPRYFDMVVKYHERMEECGDVTVPRLLYEDWRDRLQRKTQCSMDDAGFQSLIKELAIKEREGVGTIRYGDLEDMLPYFARQAGTVEELCSGGILKREDNRYRIDERLLPLGFGLLLAKEVADAAQSHDEPLDEVIAGWMEPQLEMDIKANICESAAIHALSLEGFPEKGRLALLKAWIECHNTGCSMEHDFSALMPLSPQSYVELAEAIWTSFEMNPWAEELIMRAFLRWRESPKISPIFKETFERWMGFVHPEGFFFQRGPEGKNIENTRREITERLGHEVMPGTVEEIAGCRIRIVDNEGFLRLRLFSLAVISHLPRIPYIHAFATASLAESVMGYPQKEELFAWVLRSSPDSIGEEVRRKAGQLLEYNHLLARRAASLLLYYEGSAESFRMRLDSLEDLFPPSGAWELYKKDPCNSLFAWRREDCEKCLRRTDLKPDLIARKMQSYCVDPDLPVPVDLGERLAPLTEKIELSKTWCYMFQTMEDHSIEEMEPALCAYAPRAFANLICGIVRSARERHGMALRQISWRLEEFSLILGPEELRILNETWQQLRAKAGNWTEPEEVAEFQLFPFVLQNCEPNEQLRLILDRPQKAKDLLRFEKKFRPPVDWGIVRSSFATSGDGTSLERVLWFLAANPEPIPAELLTQIASLADSANSRVCIHALEIIFKAGSEGCFRTIVEGKWAWDPEREPEENHWGSLILCEKGSVLPYSEIRSRVHPAYLGLAVEKRGLRPDEVRQYAQDIHRIWQLLGSTCPDIPSEFPAIEVECEAHGNAATLQAVGISPSLFSRSAAFASRDLFWGGASPFNKTSLQELLKPISKERLYELTNIVKQTFKEQAKAGNAWFVRDFWGDKALSAVVAQHQSLLIEWMKPVLRGGEEAERFLTLGQSFYEALCGVLLQQNNPDARALYRRLRQTPGMICRQYGKTKIAILDSLLFLGQDTAELKSLWQERLLECNTDRDLLEIAMVALRGQGEAWIWSKIEEGLRSHLPLDQARALMLAGFVDSERAYEHLKSYSKPEPNAWVEWIASKAIDRWKKNQWAKQWFRRFLSHEDNVIAWAAFRLFLCCVDSRFWHWRADVDSEDPSTPLKEKRREFVDENTENIKKRAEKNEEDYRNTFLNTKVMAGEASPWMQ